MVCLGLEPGAAGWKAQMNPLGYGVVIYNRRAFQRLLTLVSVQKVLVDILKI